MGLTLKALIHVEIFRSQIIWSIVSIEVEGLWLVSIEVASQQLTEWWPKGRAKIGMGLSLEVLINVDIFRSQIIWSIVSMKVEG